MNKKFFLDHQKELLMLANSEAGRKLLEIDDSDPIVKITPNSWHILKEVGKDKSIIQAKFFCYERVAKYLVPFLTYKDLLSDTKWMVKNKDEEYKAFLHYQGYEKYNYPYIYFDTGTYYAGGGDGHCDNANANYTTCHNASSSDSADYTSGTNQSTVDNGILTGTYYIKRSFFPVDTSGLTGAAVISAASFSHYATRGDDSDGYSVVVVPTTQASTTQVVADDYDQAGTTDCGSLDLTSYSASAAQNAITLNSTGISNISLTGTTKLGLRFSGDISSSTPSARNFTYPDSFSEDGTASHDPFYSITYSLPAGGFYYMSV